MTKMTSRIALTASIDALTKVDGFDPAVIAKLTEMVEALDRKAAKASSTPSKPTAKQIANECYKADILYTLATASEPMKIVDIINTNEHLYGDGITSQRVSALLTQLKQEGKVVRCEGRVATFTLAPEQTEGEEDAE